MAIGHLRPLLALMFYSASSGPKFMLRVFVRMGGGRGRCGCERDSPRRRGARYGGRRTGVYQLIAKRQNAV